MLHPRQFQVNEAWIAFTLNDAPIRTAQDGFFNCVCLIDAASCYILGNVLVPFEAAEPSKVEVEQLLNEGWEQKQEFPITLFIPSDQFPTNFPQEAERRGITVLRVSESELLPFIREAKEGYKEHIGAQRAPYN